MPYIPLPFRRLRSSHHASSSTPCWPVPLPSAVLLLRACSFLSITPLPSAPVPSPHTPSRQFVHPYPTLLTPSIPSSPHPLSPFIRPAWQLSSPVTSPQHFTHSHFTLSHGPAVSHDLGPILSLGTFVSTRQLATLLPAILPPPSRITPTYSRVATSLLLPFHPNCRGVVPCSSPSCLPPRVPQRTVLATSK
ncbi:hypothetical protein C8J57DRAFT_1532935 [Mycena rebaudengoi]|nr:hypothetical protein C8J57DRAFT_1532935 [Mycena rebaudengoi]